MCYRPGADSKIENMERKSGKEAVKEESVHTEYGGSGAMGRRLRLIFWSII